MIYFENSKSPVKKVNNFKEKIKIGESTYLNKNCWLVNNLKSPPYNRCRYCRFKFRQCLFLHYQVISIVLIVAFLSILLSTEGRISISAIISIFTLVIIYGYFFNKSTETIIKANFAEKEAKEAFQKLNEQLEDKVQEQTKYLEELLEMKNDFLRVVNHQLNTPLSIMKGCFFLIKEKLYTPEKALPSIENGLERLSSTVADFWDAYELEGEKIKMEPQKTNIKEIVEQQISEKQKLPIVLERKLRPEIQKPNFKIPFVWCDYKKITHVVSNLLDNAIYYTREGKITVFYGLIDDYLEINIKDTGLGLSKKDKERIFQKFSRGENATDLRPDGSGLGLFIAKKIVESNDGEMSYFSQGRNQGSIFSFTLPIYKNQKRESGEKRESREKKIVIFGEDDRSSSKK